MRLQLPLMPISQYNVASQFRKNIRCPVYSIEEEREKLQRKPIVSRRRGKTGLRLMPVVNCFYPRM